MNEVVVMFFFYVAVVVVVVWISSIVIGKTVSFFLYFASIVPICMYDVVIECDYSLCVCTCLHFLTQLL